MILLEYSQKNSIFVATILVIRPIFHDKRHSLHTAGRLHSMPKNSNGTLVLRQYPQGQHFSAEKCTQNCMIFMLKGELLINSNEYPGTTLLSRQCVLQAIGSKMELLALTEVEYIAYWFTELPLLCEDRYKEILERSEAPLIYTPLLANAKLERLLHDIADYFKEQPSACGNISISSVRNWFTF